MVARSRRTHNRINTPRQVGRLPFLFKTMTILQPDTLGSNVELHPPERRCRLLNLKIMRTAPTNEITLQLLRWSRGEQAALEQLMPVVYDELYRLAHSYLRR